jgi:hypothetical protein
MEGSDEDLAKSKSQRTLEWRIDGSERVEEAGCEEKHWDLKIGWKRE